MPVLDFMASMLVFFLFVAWFWVVVTVLSDIFRSEQLSGGAKAGWVFVVILIPWFGILGYLIAHGDGMTGRRLAV